MIAGAARVVSSRLHPALLAVASGVPVVAVSRNFKVTETFVSRRFVAPPVKPSRHGEIAVMGTSLARVRWESSTHNTTATICQVLMGHYRNSMPAYLPELTDGRISVSDAWLS